MECCGRHWAMEFSKTRSITGLQGFSNFWYQDTFEIKKKNHWRSPRPLFLLFLFLHVYHSYLYLLHWKKSWELFEILFINIFKIIIIRSLQVKCNALEAKRSVSRRDVHHKIEQPRGCELNSNSLGQIMGVKAWLQQDYKRNWIDWVQATLSSVCLFVLERLEEIEW